MIFITHAQYARGLCVCVRLCTYVRICVCVSSKNTLVYVLPLKNLHGNTLCSFFTEFIVLWLIHGFLKLRVSFLKLRVRALYGIVGVSPNLLYPYRRLHSVTHVQCVLGAAHGHANSKRAEINCTSFS